jgi:hypothetical protein
MTVKPDWPNAPDFCSLALARRSKASAAVITRIL